MKIYVLDFDGVINNQWQNNTLYPTAIELIKKMYSENKILCIATRRNQEQLPEITNLLITAGIRHCFRMIEADSRPKTHHLRKIHNELQKEINTPLDLILFDDFDVNINDVSRANYKAILVNNNHGLLQRHIDSVS